ncbi:hypothetical protein ACFLXF_04660 [Chloroflexota bacterium]
MPPELDYRYDWLEAAIEENNIGCRIVYLSNKLFQEPVIFYMSDFLHEGTTAFDPGKIASHPEKFQRQRAKLRLHLSAILRTLLDEYRPDAFVSASVGDIRWRETIKGARELGIPWVVTEREGVIAPIVFEKNITFVKSQFDPEADLMCASNELHKTYWEKIGLHGGKVVVTGDLKSDIWKNESCWPARYQIHPALREDRILLLYLAFGNRNYIDERFYPNDSRDWSPLQTEHYEVLRNIALEYHDNVQIVIKGGHLHDLSEWFSDNLEGKTPENIIILSSSYQALDLILNADIIVGFQTTALIESMFTDKPILYPAWGDLYSEIQEDLIPLHRSGAVSWVHSKEELQDCIVSFIKNRESLALDKDMLRNRKEFRESYYYRPDGKAGLRTYQAIEDFLKGRGIHS